MHIVKVRTLANAYHFSYFPLAMLWSGVVAKPFPFTVIDENVHGKNANCPNSGLWERSAGLKLLLVKKYCTDTRKQ